MLEEVAQDGGALRLAPEELRGNREVVMTAVAQKGMALYHGRALDASKEMQGDREVVLAAVAQNWWTLQFATEEMRDDREVVMSAVAQNGMRPAICYRGDARRP